MTSSLSSSFSSLFSPLLDYMEHFNFDTAPLHSFYFPLIVVPIWLLLIYSIQSHVLHTRKGQPFSCNTLFAYHNLFMSFLSFLMFFGCAYEVYSRLTSPSSLPHNVRWLVCEPSSSSSTGRLYFWSYIYYLSKYYELLDTVFLALKGKLVGWGGLNVYHHAVVVWMAWWWLEYVQTLQFIGLLFNSSVHVIMYFYFYLRSLNRPAPFRNLITLYQILQFTTSLVIFPYNLYLHLYVVKGGCSGEWALWLNLLFNITLLMEFVDILKASLGIKKKGKKGEKGSSSSGVGKGVKDGKPIHYERSEARIGGDDKDPTESEGNSKDDRMRKRVAPISYE